MRHFSAVCVVAALGAVLVACKRIDEGLLDPPRDAGGDAASDGAVTDAGDGSVEPPDAASDASMNDACVPAVEACNNRDDDCDDVIDNGADQWCEGVILNAEAACDLRAGEPVCFAVLCHDNFWSCDGLPENGCEADYCDCHVCPDDAGMDDGG